MAKLTNVRERVHQPFYDSLIRTAGFGFAGESAPVQPQTQLFTIAGRSFGRTNMQFGAALPSDQSHVTLALRVFVWFKKPEIRSAGLLAVPPIGFALAGAGNNGEIGNAAGFFNGGPGAGNAPADVHDAYRNYWQTLEQLHWSYGTGQKFSIENMPTWYFPAGGGLHGDNGGVSDLIHWNNGMPEHGAILRLARAILLPPRQNVKCQADLFTLNDAPAANVGAGAGGAAVVQNGRDLLSLRDNLNAIDGMGKIIQFVFDGLFARDVQ